eukprot:Rmarinus@m.5487
MNGKKRVVAGILEKDHMQQTGAERLQSVFQGIQRHVKEHPTVDSFVRKTHQPPPKPVQSGAGWFSGMFGSSPASSTPAPKKMPLLAPKGLYLHGTVGSGKTMLMDMFHDTLGDIPKKRVHFHSFLQNVHVQLNEYRRQDGVGTDPIPKLATRLSYEARVMCFDEFQVTDIADAVILRSFFSTLFSHGVVVVATSNRHPDELYKNGIQRQEVFVPFLRLLQEQLDVFCLDSPVDYRLRGTATDGVYFYPLNADTEAKMDKLFKQLTSGETACPSTVNVLGRLVEVDAAAKGVARISFSRLCESPLGAADYLALCREFHTILLGGLRRINIDQEEAVLRRFITFIDCAYDQRVKVIFAAEASPSDLFYSQQRTGAQAVPSKGASAGEGGGEGSLGPGSGVLRKKDKHAADARDVVFASDRAVSRLLEMQSKEYLAKSHKFWGHKH